MVNQKGTDKLIVSIVPLWRRAFAYVIDLIVISIVIFLPIKKVYGGATNGELETVMSYFSQAQEFTFGFFVISLITAILTILYWALLEYYTSQSVGKMAMGVKVVDVNGMKLKFMQCFTRSISKISTFVLFLDLLYGIVKRDQRRYFEVMSNTKVVSSNGSL